MDKRLHQAMDWLEKEKEKDNLEISNHKNQMIEDIKSWDKEKLFKPQPKKKVSFFQKLLKIMGYGEKG